MSMQSCSMTLHYAAATLPLMAGWEVEYLRHVADKTGRSLSSIAREAGLSSTTLTRPVNDPEHVFAPKLSTLEKVERVTGIALAPFQKPSSEAIAVTRGEPAGLMDTAERIDFYEHAPPDRQLVPVFDLSASAGYGALVNEYEAIAYSLAFPPNYLRRVTSANPRDLAIISVKGDSMSPTLHDDDIVMIDTSKTSLGYDGLFVLRFDDALHVKRISRGRPGHVRIISDNKVNYPELEYPVEDITVIGKVIWSGGKK